MRGIPRLLVVLVLSRVCFCASQGFAVVVWDYAGLPDSMVNSSIRFAQQAFQRVDVKTDWMVCRIVIDQVSGCKLPPADSFVTMLVMPKMRPQPGSSADSAGLAIVGDETGGQARAWAFYDAALRVANQTERPVFQVLGCILVHEIAHVLGLHHGYSGIMRRTLVLQGIEEAARGRMFSDLEIKQLSAGAARLAARTEHTYLAAKEP